MKILLLTLVVFCIFYLSLASNSRKCCSPDRCGMTCESIANQRLNTLAVNDEEVEVFSYDAENVEAETLGVLSLTDVPPSGFQYDPATDNCASYCGWLAKKESDQPMVSVFAQCSQGWIVYAKSKYGKCIAATDLVVDSTSKSAYTEFIEECAKSTTGCIQTAQRKQLAVSRAAVFTRYDMKSSIGADSISFRLLQPRRANIPASTSAPSATPNPDSNTKPPVKLPSVPVINMPSVSVATGGSTARPTPLGGRAQRAVVKPQ